MRPPAYIILYGQPNYSYVFVPNCIASWHSIWDGCQHNKLPTGEGIWQWSLCSVVIWTHASSSMSSLTVSHLCSVLAQCCLTSEFECEPQGPLAPGMTHDLLIIANGSQSRPDKATEARSGELEPLSTFKFSLKVDYFKYLNRFESVRENLGTMLQFFIAQGRFSKSNSGI